jgi:hypothetical protein
MGQGSIRKVFPGGNTAYGFYSFYDNIIQEDAARIFVIKGGPGVGKSTFMRKIADEVLRRGLDVEYECCSSDNKSIDGIVIPVFGIAMIDGTAPQSGVAPQESTMKKGRSRPFQSLRGYAYSFLFRYLVVVLPAWPAVPPPAVAPNVPPAARFCSARAIIRLTMLPPTAPLSREGTSPR